MDPAPTRDQVDPVPGRSVVTEAVAESLARYYSKNFNRALAHCTDESKPNPRYIYNALYWYHRAMLDTLVQEIMGPALLAKMEAKAVPCLSFELDFDSTIQTISEGHWMTSRVRAEGIKLQIPMNGEGLKSEVYPLQYLTFDWQMDTHGTGCYIASKEFSDGTFKVTGGALKIREDLLSLDLHIVPRIATETAYISCPNGGAYPAQPYHWGGFFNLKHVQEAVGETYAIKKWKYNGGENFAEAIYEESLSSGDTQINETTFFVLVHTPKAK